MVDYILLEEYAKDITVLFVEDDENIRKEIHELLLNMFSCVDTAVDGEDGFKKYLNYAKVNKKNYDLVITDIKMPNINGIELTRMIYKENSSQPVIVLSAYNDSENLMQLVNIGIAQFITKPIDVNDFVHIMFNITKDIYFKNNEIINAESSIVKLDSDVIWDKEIKKLTKNGEDIKLTKKELLFVDLLLKVTEKTYTVEEIISHLWEGDEENSPDVKNLKNIISRLRKKIPELDIENVYSFGYKINIL